MIDLIPYANIFPENFQKIIPALGPWISSLNTNKLALFFQNLFAFIEIFHILGLFMLGGAVIMISLRLIGVGLVELPASQIQRSVRIWMTIGVVLAIVTGLMIGLSNASKLYNNSAFLFKMIAMIAAIIFSYFVLIPVAKADGKADGRAKIGLLLAGLIWIVSLIVLIENKGSNVGIVHILAASSLISFAALKGKARWIMTGGLAIIVGAWQYVTHVTTTLGTTAEQAAAYDKANFWFIVATAVWLLGAMLLNVTGRIGPKDSNALARLVGYATILVWVTVGVGGRWIGLT
ncbi:hypothetical protein BH11PSE2_BH11PSE2_21770 [soil metagenome]